MYKSTYEAVADGKGTWLKTNFHIHAGVCIQGQCGVLPFDDVIDAYIKAGYDVLSISNHDRYIPNKKEYPGIKIIDAIEYTADPHMLLIGINEFHNVQHQDAIKKTVKAGGFVILCHPNWQYREYLPYKFMDTLSGYTGIEIVNGGCFSAAGSGLALDTWDYLLSQGKQTWGFGNDDFHHFHHTDRACNMIYAKSPAYTDIQKAVKDGCFYVSTGIALKEFALEKDELYVKAGYFKGTYIKNFEYKITGFEGRVLLKTEGESVRFRIPANEPYVRVEAAADFGAKIYLQPVFLPSM